MMNMVSAQQELKFGVEIQPKLTTFIHDNGNKVEATEKLGFSFAGNAYLDLNNRLSFKTGLSINSIRLNLRDYAPVFPCDIDATNGMVDTRNSYNDFEFPMLYLGIPAQIKWLTSEKEKHFYLKAGVETYFKLVTKGSQEVIECGTNTISVEGTLGGINSLLILSGFGIGYEVPLQNGSKFYIEPNLEYSLSPLFKGVDPMIFNSNIATNGNLLNIGLIAGLLF